MSKVNFTFKDEVGTNLNRYEATNISNGQKQTLDLVRKANIQTNGTLLNASNLNALITAINDNVDNISENSKNITRIVKDLTPSEWAYVNFDYGYDGGVTLDKGHTYQYYCNIHGAHRGFFSGIVYVADDNIPLIFPTFATDNGWGDFDTLYLEYDPNNESICIKDAKTGNKFDYQEQITFAYRKLYF